MKPSKLKEPGLPKGEKAAIPPSTQYSDSLFHLDKRLDLMVAALERKSFTLNYVEEDFSFLNIEGLDKVAFAMLCFCDIPIDGPRIKPHSELYGKFGLGLTKEWGRRVGVQPIHYLPESSPFVNDLKDTLSTGFALDYDAASPDAQRLADFLPTVLAYAKPLWGYEFGRDYCYEDECEWRYVPSALPLGLEVFIPSPTAAELDDYRKTLWRRETFGLEFEYSDITCIFASSEADTITYIQAINKLDIPNLDKDILKTKIRSV